MSVLSNIFTSIANAIRTKNGSSNTYLPENMAQAILDIPSGSGSEWPDELKIQVTASSKGTTYQATSLLTIPDITKFPYRKINVTKPSGYGGTYIIKLFNYYVANKSSNFDIDYEITDTMLNTYSSTHKNILLQANSSSSYMGNVTFTFTKE